MHDSPPTQSLAVQAVQTRRLRTPLVREVRHFFLRHPIPGGALLLACSGGPDSTALLLSCWLLQRALNLTLHVAVVDHGLRSAGKTEAQQVAALALQLGIPAHILSVTVEPGASLQAQARQARLAALHQCAQDHGLTHVAFGHTLEDQSETMLMRWLGGAGLAGLSGIAAVQRLPHASTQMPTDLFALRPLLRVSHDQIHAFLQPLSGLLCGLPVLDPSNQDPRFLRVRLRTEILPPLRALSPRLDQHLSELSQQLREDHAYLAQETQRVLAALVSRGGWWTKSDHRARSRFAPICSPPSRAPSFCACCNRSCLSRCLPVTSPRWLDFVRSVPVRSGLIYQGAGAPSDACAC